MSDNHSDPTLREMALQYAKEQLERIYRTFPELKPRPEAALNIDRARRIFKKAASKKRVTARRRMSQAKRTWSPQQRAKFARSMKKVWAKRKQRTKEHIENTEAQPTDEQSNG